MISLLLKVIIKNAFDLIWHRMSQRRGHWEMGNTEMGHREWLKISKSWNNWHALSRTFGRKANAFQLPYNAWRAHKINLIRGYRNKSSEIYICYDRNWLMPLSRPWRFYIIPQKLQPSRNHKRCWVGSFDLTWWHNLGLPEPKFSGNFWKSFLSVWIIGLHFVPKLCIFLNLFPQTLLLHYFWSDTLISNILSFFSNLTKIRRSWAFQSQVWPTLALFIIRHDRLPCVHCPWGHMSAGADPCVGFSADVQPGPSGAGLGRHGHRLLVRLQGELRDPGGGRAGLSWGVLRLQGEAK